MLDLFLAVAVVVEVVVVYIADDFPHKDSVVRHKDFAVHHKDFVAFVAGTHPVVDCRKDFVVVVDILFVVDIHHHLAGSLDNHLVGSHPTERNFKDFD